MADLRRITRKDSIVSDLFDRSAFSRADVGTDQQGAICDVDDTPDRPCQEPDIDHVLDRLEQEWCNTLAILNQLRARLHNRLAAPCPFQPEQCGDDTPLAPDVEGWNPDVYA